MVLLNDPTDDAAGHAVRYEGVFVQRLAARISRRGGVELLLHAGLGGGRATGRTTRPSASRRWRLCMGRQQRAVRIVVRCLHPLLLAVAAAVSKGWHCRPEQEMRWTPTLLRTHSPLCACSARGLFRPPCRRAVRTEECCWETGQIVGRGVRLFGRIARLFSYTAFRYTTPIRFPDTRILAILPHSTYKLNYFTNTC